MRVARRGPAALAGLTLVAGLGVAIRAHSSPAIRLDETSTTARGSPTGPPVRVCGNRALLDGPAATPAGAVMVDAGDNSDFFAAESYRHDEAAGTVYWFAPGVHTLGAGEFGQIHPATETTFIGAPGAVLDGQGVNRSAFTGKATDVTIRYLTIQHFNSFRDQGVVNHDSGTGWTIDHTTIRDNHGAGAFLGPSGRLWFDCLANNGQYGFQGFGGVQVVDHVEVVGNNTDNLEVTSDGRPTGCGCTGGAKFWAAQHVSLTNNWVHNNRGPGLWADTDDADFLVSGNYIDDNEDEGFLYEISYNATIRNNTFVRNAIAAGRRRQASGDTFPEGAIYISESGGDHRVPSSVSGSATIEVSGNRFVDNWDGVVLWENADRFCGSPANTSGGYCTLVSPGVTTATCADGHFGDGSTAVGSPTYASKRASFWYTDIGAALDSPNLPSGTTIAAFNGDPTRVTLSAPASGTSSGLDFTIGGRSSTNQLDSGQPYLSDCRWKTQNVTVHENLFTLDRSAVGCTTDLCGRQGVFSNSGTFPPWSPYKGSVVEDAITFSQGNRWRDNEYDGPWTFVPHDQGRRIAFAAWQTAPYAQDVGSTCSGC